MNSAFLNKLLFRGLANDLLAGLVVFLVALPMCLGIALASGAPILSGLLSGMVGGMVVGALSGSATSVSGPAAGLTAVIASQIVAFGSFETFLMAVALCGVIQITMGVLRLGFLASLVPPCVINGVLFSIGLVLMSKQCVPLLGLEPSALLALLSFAKDSPGAAAGISELLTHSNQAALVIGVGSLLLLIAFGHIEALKRVKIVVYLLVILFGIAGSFAFSGCGPSWSISDSFRVQVPVIETFFQVRKMFTWPDLTTFMRTEILFGALVLAVVASLETLVNIDAVDRLDPKQRKTPANRELLAQGFGNLLLGLIGGLPVTSVVVRSSVNISANCRSKASTMFHGLLILVLTLFLPQVLNLIPLSCLAAILVIAGWKLAHPKLLFTMWSRGWHQFLPFALTVVSILLTDLLLGVLCGLSLSLLFILMGKFGYPLKPHAKFGSK